MQLREFSFTDKCTEWNLLPTLFDPLTLLVGVSGVGKTKILDAIEILPRLAEGNSYNGIKWRAVFLDESQGEVLWEGETECVDNKFDDRQIPFSPSTMKPDSEKAEFPICYERIVSNGIEVFSRNNKRTLYKGKETVKLQDTKSLVSVLQEDDVSGFKDSFRKINYSADQMGILVREKHASIYLNGKTLQELIDDENIGTATKLYICSVQFPEIFRSIKNAFIEIFSFVEDFKFLESDALSYIMEPIVPDRKVLQLKEIGSDMWVPAWDFSSGMHKTLNLLTAIYLSPRGSIFIIDEFENSFGVNCINEITEKMIRESAQIQFILSSHHPYIINSVKTEHWRLITRKNRTVSSSSVMGRLSDKSKHEAFLQLINMDSFVDGIEP